MLDNYSAGLTRAEIERVVGNQNNRSLRKQQNSKALSASKGITTADCGKGKNRRQRNESGGYCFNCGKKGHQAGECRSAMKSEKSGDTVAYKKDGGKASATCAGVKSTLRTSIISLIQESLAPDSRM